MSAGEGTGQVHGPGPTDAAVPAEVAERARAAFSARDRHADLADLVADSLDDGRTDPATRTVSFSGAGVRVSVRRATQALVVVVDPAPDGPLEVQDRQDASMTVTCTGAGQWEVAPVPQGPVSLVVHDGTRRVRTAWTRW